jgi:pimeloyl-ACP methyl ester carboxylesterase
MTAPTLLALAPLLLAPAGPPGAPPGKAGDVRTEPFPLKDRSGRDVGAELWRLAVPENRHDPTPRLIEIAFVRLRSTAERPGPPLVFLAGGPGSSGVEAARGPALPLFLALREAGDVLLLDQRGTGRSLPSLNSAVTWDLPLDRPGDPDALLAACKDRLRGAAQALTRQGIDLSAYNPEEVADDVDAVRGAVGAGRVNLWGVSYGTHVALAALRRHEKGINRVILTAAVGPDQALLKRPRAVQEQLGRAHEALRQTRRPARACPTSSARSAGSSTSWSGGRRPWKSVTRAPGSRCGSPSAGGTSSSSWRIRSARRTA